MHSINDDNYQVTKLLFFRNFSFENKLHVNAIQNGRISFAYEEMVEFPLEIVKILWKDITHLDLSGNNISNFEFLNGFVHLKSLIVDENLSIGIERTRSTFPKQPKLELFYCNNCEIPFPAEFIRQISTLFPKIKYLSLMEFKTVVVDEKNLHHLRMFAIFMNPFLLHFNDKRVSDEEKEYAKKFHKYLCIPPSTTLMSSVNLHEIVGVKKKGEITQQIEQFFEEERIEKFLSSVSVSDYFL